MKALIVVDFAYKSPKRTGRGTGRKGLSSTLKYLQFRDARNNARARQQERWQDRGMGVHWREILKHSEALQSPHVLAWTWVVSPAPDLMALVPEDQRRDLLHDLTERVVEDYYEARGFDTPEYSYVTHTAETEGGAEHLHTHVVLPGTAPTVAERQPVYNNKERGHDALFREIATDRFAEMLDERGIAWRHLRPTDPPAHDLEAWFPR